MKTNNQNPNWDKDVPIWDELGDEKMFIVGASFPKRFWNCVDSKENLIAFKEIFKAHKISFPENSSFQELKKLFKETFRKVNLEQELLLSQNGRATSNY